MYGWCSFVSYIDMMQVLTPVDYHLLCLGMYIQLQYGNTEMDEVFISILLPLLQDCAFPVTPSSVC